MLEFLAIPVVAGGVSLLFGKKWNDKQKLEKIFENTGLYVKENNRIKKLTLYREDPHSWGCEYVYKLPLGLSFEDVEKRYPAIKNGLNNKRQGQQKEIELSFDGMVRIKVYEYSMPQKYDLNTNLITVCEGWSILVGKNQTETIFHDFDKYPHLLVAGATQWGKTVFLKMLTTTLIIRHPKTVKFSFLDLKGGLAFNRFKNLQQTNSVASNLKESLKLLKDVKKEVEQRLIDFKKEGFENIRDSGIKERHFIVVDEAAELSPHGYKGEERKLRQEIENLMSYIARVAGGLGYRLIYATQYPTSEVLPRQIKANCDGKVCFHLQNGTQSKVVLDEIGAEKITVKGRCIYVDTEKTVTLQTPYIENDFINEVITPYIVAEQSEKVVENEHNTIKQRKDTRNIIEFI